MKKGTFYPQVRTKWVCPFLGERSGSPPTYINCSVSGTFLYIDGDGHVFPRPIKRLTDGPVNWQYNQEAGAVFYKFPVGALDLDMTCIIIQEIDPATGKTMFHVVWLNDVGGISAEQDIDPITYEGIWPYDGVHDPFNAGTLFFPEPQIPILALDFCRAAFYVDIWPWANADDLSPEAWTNSFF